MKKGKMTFMSFGLLLLVTSCGVSSTINTIDPELLKESVNRISLKDEANYSTYYSYINRVNEARQDNYLSKSSRQEVIPEGGFELNNQIVEAEEAMKEAPNYAKVFLSHDTMTYHAKGLTSSKLGRYRLKLEYYVPTNFASAPLVNIKVNGQYPFTEAETIGLPLLYKDNVPSDEFGNDKVFDKTRHDDEMSPNQTRVKGWQNEGIYETTFLTSEPLVFDFDTVKPIISITNLSDREFYVGKLTLEPVEKPLTYAEYSKNLSSLGTDSYELNAINYTHKNSNETTLANEQSPAVTPYEHDRKLLNVTSGWDTSGQSITWKFNVDSAGYYPLTMHYYNDMSNFPLYRKIEVNGKVPFAEVENYEFPTTGAHYSNETLHDEEGNPYYFYFDSGINTITLTATTEPLLDIYTNLMAVYNDINDFSIEIRKITGSAVDAYKEYYITKHFPTLVGDLQAYKNIITDSYYKLLDIVGNDKSSSVLSYFQRMFELIDEIIEEPDDLPLNLAKFSSGDNCLAKLIADTANSLKTTNMILDTIYVTNDESQIRPSNASWTSSFYSSLVTLGQTFTSDKYKTKLKDGELNIWSARAQSYNDILQTFADNEFTPNTICEEYPEGIKVNIRQMPSEDNLIYAYAADTVPDLVLGINSGRAFEFALRGDAAFPLSDFGVERKWKYTNKNHWGFTPYYWDVVDNMPHGQLMSMLYNDKFYSLPESTSAQLMFSRDDIMNVMGDNNTPLPLPQTWDELIGILPRIQSYGMNFYYPTSATGSLKGLASTAQFILQNNGSLLSKDGYTSNLRDDNTYEGLKLLTDLYTIYSLPTEVGSFYNHFRYGTYPMGIGDVGMYLSLKYVAPELLGKWSVHEIPGIEQELQSDGTYADLNNDGIGDQISRWFISNGSAAMIFNNSKLIDEAWLFLQWWMSTSVQENFTDALQATFGPSVVWFSSNLDAAKSLPIDSDVREVVLNQVKWILDLQQIPGQYMLERGLSDIWNQVVFGKSSSGEASTKLTIGEAIDLQKVLMDREIQRKMEEFGYYDTQAGQGTTKYIIRNFQWVEECFNNFKNGKDGGNPYSPNCPI